MTTTTRTLNPLPFQDLEPHRFEDLVRQLAYDYREWSELQATGRGGGDDGFDIRALERVARERSEDGEDADSGEETAWLERVWAFQCKREKALGPKRMEVVIAETFAAMVEVPHGFVLAVASDVSKKSRDVFRREMLARGVEEFAVWAKGELEDMLFQPRHDGLLFAYFGISLQPRRRSLATSLRAEIAKKKQLHKLLFDRDDDGGYWQMRPVLLRDPTDENYRGAIGEGGRWRACDAHHLKQDGYLVVRIHKYLAALNRVRSGWDAIEAYDLTALEIEHALRQKNAWAVKDESDGPDYHSFWNEFVDEDCRAHLHIFAYVPLSRVLAVDPLGDGHFPIPHLLIDYDLVDGPFLGLETKRLTAPGEYGIRVDLPPNEANRVEIFPREISGTLGPPPKEFDDTLGDVSLLAASSEDKLRELMSRLSAQRLVRASGRDSVTTEPSAADAASRVFEDWRESIAMPVFSSFVARLRDSGHGGSVRARQLDRGASVELDVKLRSSTPYNPECVVSGKLSVSISASGRWTIEVVPPADQGSRRTTTRAPGDGAGSSEARAFSKEELEELVLGMLERLGS